MSRFFVARPIFAAVLAIIVMLVGLIAIRTLPVAQYPNIAPPQVGISASFPGASARTVESSVTQVIEQQLKGLDHLLYFTSSSDSSGQAQIQATFEPGTNADIAQVQVQNKVAQANPLLPAEVQLQGVTVAKSQNAFLLIVAVYDTSGRYTTADISDMINSRLLEPLARVNGVGDIQTFEGQYAMRIWLDPLKLQAYKLMPSDVRAAVEAQNVPVPAGEIGGQPTIPGQELNATITAQSLLQTPQQFADIVLKTEANGSQVRLGDVARVEMGAEQYQAVSRINGHPGAGLAIKLAPGANALTTVDAVKKRAIELSRGLPPGVKLVFPVDSTAFVKLSIRQVVITLVEAVVLVILVMFVFLQDWRVTLIPALAVPVVLLGTFGVLAVAGYSINTLTLFAMVLAIGLLVDDAIVVVENIERIMSEEGLSPRAATLRSMDEITPALLGISTVLSAVFLPMAFFRGGAGVIYRQFSVTIVSAMALSVLTALILTPALCAVFLRPVEKGHRAQRGFFGAFNRGFGDAVTRYQGALSRMLRRPTPALIGYGVLVVILALLFLRMPTGFLPEEDQGGIITQYTLPTGAVQARTLAVARQVERYFIEQEARNVDTIFVVAGFNFAGSGQNAGIAFLHLKDWKYRPGKANKAQAIAQRANRAFSQIRDAQVFVLVPPAVRELGQTSGFDFELEDRAGLGHAALEAAQDQFLATAAKDPVLAGVRANSQPDHPQLRLEVDRSRAGSLGLSQADINDTLSAAWGGEFINNFLDRGRVKRVYMQGDAAYRASPSDIGQWYVRGSSGNMAPFSAFSTATWGSGPSSLGRYNGVPALEIQGQPAPGQSSGAAMAEVQKLISRLPAGFGFDWTGISYQERLSGAQAPALYGLSLLVVFLCLAALYESWSVPLAVILVVPLGVFGAVLAATLRGLTNDIYFQVGLLTTIGLAAKNAILIVQFADEAERRGDDPFAAAMEAARLRLRPILMTSLAFVAGVFPLAISNGAGAASQNDIGTGVVGGMVAATALAIFFTPLFFLLVRRTFRGRGAPATAPAAEPAE